MKNLESVLKMLSEKNVPGVVSYARVYRELKDASPFMSRVKIVDNNRFSLEYNHDINEVVLNTTYSNQVVDVSYIEELNILNQAKELLNKEVSN